MTMVPLTRRPGGVQAYKLVIPAGAAAASPTRRPTRATSGCTCSTAGCGWCSASRTWCCAPGEAAEFDTRVPHWFGSAEGEPVEILSLFGPQGERMHVRARSTRR